MRTDILVVSFHRDVEFLRYALRSIQAFASGFGGVTVAVPTRDVHLFDFVESYGASLGVFNEHTSNGMMHHEDQIMQADLWCKEADAILHMDSDCIFWEPATPDDYFAEGKPILYRERYATLTNKLRLNWHTATKRATGIDCEWECMVRHPAVHLRETYVKARELIQAHTGKDPSDYILSCDGKFPQGFAEFPTLGAVAIHHFPDKYHFVEYDVKTPDGGYPYDRSRDKMKAFWSHGGIERYRAEAEAILL